MNTQLIAAHYIMTNTTNTTNTIDTINTARLTSITHSVADDTQDIDNIHNKQNVQTVKKVYIKTFGCQMNVYDSDKMVDVLHAAKGMIRTDHQDDADVILFNTCSVREKAQEKVFSDLGRALKLKRKNPNLIIGVGGCVASQEGAAIVQRAPYVDLVFGPQTLHRLPQMIDARHSTNQSQVDISFPEIEKFDHLPPPRKEGPTAYVSIMEGCSKYCSFCVVPYTRGEEINRPLEDILTEIADLADQGVKEVSLLGQNVNAYRGKLNVNDTTGDIIDFATLLEYVHEIPGIERIRFLTSHPKEMTQKLIDTMGRLPKLANYLHLPVQAGSDHVLNAMKRGYTALEYKNIIKRVRAVRPDICLSSDFIVGFPGETEADFEQTMKLIIDLNFDTSFSFVYSRRPGTPAADLNDNTTDAIKLARLQRLQAQIILNAKAISLAMLGSTQTILVEGLSKKNEHELMGRTENMRIVNFSGHKRLIGHMVRVRIIDVQPNSLRGEIVI